MTEYAPILARYLAAKSSGERRAWTAKRWTIRENEKLAGKLRDPLRLYLTDIGKCKRQIAYRLRQERKRPLTPAKVLMFEQAQDIENTVAAALVWAGELESFQAPVAMPGENWGGRMDIVAGGRIIEVKSSRSAAFKGYRADDMPKPDHLTQAGLYSLLQEMPADLLYMDRGGENQPQQYEAPPASLEWLLQEMDGFERVRASLDNLPDCLPPMLKRRSVRKSSIVLGDLRIDWAGEVWLEQDWRCSYCDYEHCPAKRRESVMLAKLTKSEPLTLTAQGKRMADEVQVYLHSGLREMPL